MIGGNFKITIRLNSLQQLRNEISGNFLRFGGKVTANLTLPCYVCGVTLSVHPHRAS
jgi:hypothetical protein